MVGYSTFAREGNVTIMNNSFWKRFTAQRAYKYASLLFNEAFLSLSNHPEATYGGERKDEIWWDFLLSTFITSSESDACDCVLTSELSSWKNMFQKDFRFLECFWKYMMYICDIEVREQLHALLEWKLGTSLRFDVVMKHSLLAIVGKTLFWVWKSLNCVSINSE